MKIWIISDSHFNHEAIKTKFEFRPENFEEQICRKIKNNVWEDDLLIHLWDVIFNRPSELNKYLLAMWKCTKILIKWNHDKNWNEFYYNQWFNVVADEIIMDNIVFTHIPKPSLEKGQINIHWHLHSNSHHINEYTNNPENYICYSAEEQNYMPILLTQFLKKLKTKNKNYEHIRKN